MSPQAKSTEAKINKWVHIKLKRFLTAKECINETKRQPTEWEKIFANDTSDEGLLSKLHKEFIQLSTQKTIWFKHGQKTWRHFSKESMWIANSLHKKVLNITNHQGNTNQNHNKILSHICQNDYHQKDKKWQVLVMMWRKGNSHTIQQFHSWVFIQRKWNTNPKSYMHPNVYFSIIYKSQGKEAT